MVQLPSPVIEVRGTCLSTSGITIIITGTLTRNTAPHQKCSSKAPPAKGPMAAPAEPVAPHIPNASARSRSSSKVWRRMAKVQGMIIAEPNAMNARAAIKAATLGEKAASTEPRLKMHSPVISNWRWPIRSARVPMGINRLAMSSG